MTAKLKLNYLKFGIPILILLFLIVLPKTTAFQNAPEELSIGILLDLLITIPLVFFFLIRKTKVPKFTIIYSFILGLIVAGLVIPIEYQSLLSSIKLIAIPVLEIGVISLIIYKITSINSSFKKTKKDDFYDNLLIACNEVLPGRVGKVLATEIAVIYFLFSPSRKNELREQEFTYFKKSGIKSILGVFLFLLVIETIGVHLVMATWSLTIAWVLSFLSLYTMVQIIAILRSMNKRPIRIDLENESLHLRYGFGCQTSISFESIERIEKSRKSLSNDKSNVCLSLFDLLDSNNTIIYLNEENTLQKIYGIQKKYTSISLFVDERDLFVDTIEQVLKKY